MRRSPRSARCRTAGWRSRWPGARCASIPPLRRTLRACVFADPGFCAINALALPNDGSLIATDGSTQRGVDDWARDLMELGRSGRVFRLDPATGSVVPLASRARLCVRGLRRRRRPSCQRELAPSCHRRRARRRHPRRARPSAGLSVAAGAGERRRLLAHGLHRAHPARRIRAARARLSPPHDGRDRSCLLGGAAAALRPVVQGADAGRAPEDHGCHQALGAAALLRARDPPRCAGHADLFAAQPRRRTEPRHRRGRRGRTGIWS